MNSTGWKVIEKDSRLYYSRVNKITSKEILSTDLIISREKSDLNLKKKIQEASKVVLISNLQNIQIQILGVVLRQGCSIKLNGIEFTIGKVYVKDGIVDQDVIVTDKTIIEIEKEKVEEIIEKIQDLEIQDFTENSKLKEITEIVMMPIMYPKLVEKMKIQFITGVLIHGPPGVGKTRLVLDLVKNTRSKLVIIKTGISDVDYAQKELINGFKKAKLLSKNGPCILMIDEIDSLTPIRNNGKDARYLKAFKRNRVVAQLLTLMDGIEERSQFIVMATTNRPNEIDPALRRPGRFDREVFMDVPQEVERFQILKSLTRKMRLTDNVDLEQIAKITNGYVAADLVDLCREALLASKDFHIEHQDFTKAFKISKGPSIKRGFQLSIEKLGWDDIAGLDDIRDLLIRNIEWPLKYPDTYVRLGLKPPRGILLYGPPGCSKTTIAKILASTTKSSFYSLNGAQIFSAYVGESERIIRDLFSRARMSSPSIIFLDELEAIVGSRGLDGSGGTQDVSRDRVLSTLLNEMDGIEVAKGILVIVSLSNFSTERVQPIVRIE
jgi:transitional endoplasmic reticulum ATPase